MKIALLFCLFPEEQKKEIIANSKRGIQFAADTLQQAIVKGFLDMNVTDGMYLINLPMLGAYPKYYREFKSSSNRLNISDDQNSLHGINKGFCHLVGYQLISRYLNAKSELLKWMEKGLGNKIVLIYGIHTPFLKAAVAVKKLYPNLKICQIVPDLPEYMASSGFGIYNFLRNINYKLQARLYPYVDYYVLLSKYMTECLPVGNKPWTVVEGIYNSSSDDVSISKRDSKEKWVLYSGSLSRRYGILNLVKAFLKIKNKDYRLIICGKGDAEKEICVLAKKDSRIIYKGQLERSEVLKLQRQSNLLINPRTPEGAFTKYSFPSKTMEYLASGIPTLLYKLPGIPEEYYKYCFSLGRLGIEELSLKIEEILTKDEKFLFDFGQEARNFILKEKNPAKQCKKIIDLINRT